MITVVSENVRMKNTPTPATPIARLKPEPSFGRATSRARISTRAISRSAARAHTYSSARSARPSATTEAGPESWFDETMKRAEGAYKRWASLVLFLVGLFLAVAGNASTTDVARDLWSDSGTRAAVADAAGNIDGDPEDLGTVSEELDKLQAFHLPVGWDVADEDNRANGPIDFIKEATPGEFTVTALGWGLTAPLVMLGGPFWFNLLTKLVSLRSSGSKPQAAADDDTSATSVVTAESTKGAPLVAAEATTEATRRPVDLDALNVVRDLIGAAPRWAPELEPAHEHARIDAELVLGRPPSTG